MASIAISQGIGIFSGILKSELAQHTVRLRDAANENDALDALIPAFDADLENIVAAFNAGTSANACIAALQAVDTNAYNYLRAQVGKPGTAWTAPSSGQIGEQNNPSYSADCNKGCTAGCCVYLNDLRPAIFGRVAAGKQITRGLIQSVQEGQGVTVVPTIAAPPNTKYGNYSRAAYSLTVQAPSGISLTSAVLSASGSGPGFAVVAAPKSLASSLTSGTAVAILGVIGGLILIITALFGQNALRVSK